MAADQIDPLPEVKTSVHWQSCFENALIQGGKGLIVGGAIGFVLFTRPVSRAGFVGITTGIGLGRSWMQCCYNLESAPRARFGDLGFPTLPGGWTGATEGKK